MNNYVHLGMPDDETSMLEYNNFRIDQDSALLDDQYRQERRSMAWPQQDRETLGAKSKLNATVDDQFEVKERQRSLTSRDGSMNFIEYDEHTEQRFLQSNALAPWKDSIRKNKTFMDKEVK